MKDENPPDPRSGPPPASPREDESGDFPSADEIVGTLFETSTLWPLLIVFLGTGGAFGAAMLVLAFGDRNLFAAAALVLVLGMTVDVFVRARKNPGMRNLARLIAGFWLSAIVLAGIAVYAGIT